MKLMKQYADRKEIFIFQKYNTLNDVLKNNFIKALMYEKALKTEKKN